MRIIIATIKSWNVERAKAMQEKYQGQHEILICTKKEELTLQKVEEYAPDYIFLPHWSFYLPEEITRRFQCVVFHMTDLPYGRGGSPLQNLIVRGHKETKISAIQVTSQFDAGPVYMKKKLTLEGSAQEIFVRAADIIFSEMIPCFLRGEMTPVEQVGEPVVFKRRKPEESEIKADMQPETIYDYIRMLDAEGYPRAYLDYGKYRLSFEEASFQQDTRQITARVIFEEQD